MNQDFMEFMFDLVSCQDIIDDPSNILYPLQVVKKFCIDNQHGDELCRICGQQTIPTSEFEPEWVQCEHCQQWVHIYCDGIHNQQLLSTMQYVCPFCRTRHCLPHPCTENDMLAKDPRQEAELKKFTGRPKKDKPKKEEKVPALEVIKVDQDQLLEDLCVIIGPESPYKEVTPQQSLIWLRSSFSAVKQQVIPVYRQALLRCQKTQKIQDINMQNDDCVTENIISLFFREYLETIDPIGQRKIEEWERKNKPIIENLISTRGGPDIDMKQHMKLFLPVLPDDAKLREKLTTVTFDCILEHIEQIRFSYIKTILPEVARATLIYQDLSQNLDPSILTLTPEKIYNYFGTLYLNPEPDLSPAAYLPAHKLLSSSSKQKLNKPDKITSRQWFDLTSRGVKHFQGITLIRQTILLALVQVGLGANILDRVFSEQLTNSCIQFGADSARRLAGRLARHDAYFGGFGAAMKPAAPCEHEFADTKCQCGIPEDGKVGEKTDIDEDSQIQDWDILETPSSVVWGLKAIGDFLEIRID
ncbi:PHD-finger domain-containing protein [Spironucleus salmonicida]|uniref:PHD-finger domain-containing protein n=1 Tax=Spironucleus salmonicida TaxID=348837 RepID=V6M4I4_9EUKA|nr:PHD-finger domain-containing protein [Spironucleus salmonicida]|eukprot:EST48234.1 PHD-finger domain-containing protein [Spironucleus salmonicida]